MLENLLIFSVGGALAAAYFYASALSAAYDGSKRFTFVALTYLAAMIISYLLADAKTAFVVLELGLAFTLISKLLVINFHMVHSPNYPKHRRCY